MTRLTIFGEPVGVRASDVVEVTEVHSTIGGSFSFADCRCCG